MKSAGKDPKKVYRQPQVRDYGNIKEITRSPINTGGPGETTGKSS